MSSSRARVIADVEQPALLAQVGVPSGRRTGDERERDRQRVPPTRRREPSVDKADEEDRRELEALGLVDGQDRDGVRLAVEVGRRRIVAGLDERPEMAGHERAAIVGEQRRLGADDIEEPGRVSS